MPHRLRVEMRNAIGGTIERRSVRRSECGSYWSSAPPSPSRSSAGVPIKRSSPPADADRIRDDAETNRLRPGVIQSRAGEERAPLLLNDFRYAIRTLRRAPVFSAAVILTVALAVGANTAIFSVVNAVIIRPLPFADPGRLVQVVEKNDAMHLPTFGVSALNYLSWKEQTQPLQLAAIGFGTFSLSGSGEPEQFTGSPIPPSLLPIVGLSPIAGRAFTEDEAKPGAPRVVMIGEGLWKRRFGSDPALIGRTL